VNAPKRAGAAQRGGDERACVKRRHPFSGVGAKPTLHTVAPAANDATGTRTRVEDARGRLRRRHRCAETRRNARAPSPRKLAMSRPVRRGVNAKTQDTEAGSPDRIQFSRHLSAAVANARFPGPRISGILDHRANQRVGDFSLIWHLRRHSRAAEKMYYRPYRHGSSSVLWFFSEANGKISRNGWKITMKTLG